MHLRSLLVGGSILVTGFVMMPGCSGSGVTSGGGDGGASGGGATTCASTGQRVCERACACGGAAGCKTGIRNSFGSFTTFTWSDDADCDGGYAVSRCKNGGSPAVDYAACASAIEAAACEGDVFVVPASCEAPKDAGK